MRAEPRDAEALAEIVGIIWEESPEELTETIGNYMNSDDSAVFAESMDGRFVGVALCGLRRDEPSGVSGRRQHPRRVSRPRHCQEAGRGMRAVGERERLHGIRQRLRTYEYRVA